MSVTTGPRPSTIFNRYSFEFDGTDDYISIDDADDLSFGNGSTDSPFTFSMWAKVDDLTTAHVLIEKQDTSSNREYIFYIDSDGTIYNNIYSNGVSLNRRGRKTSTGLISPNTWYHIAWTYDGQGGTNASDGIKIYLNGTRVDNANNQKNSYVAMMNTSFPLKIGEFINGNMDEVAVFNTELSQSDITTIYNNGIPNDISSISGLVSWWRMGKNATWTGREWNPIPDVNGNNDGIGFNMAEDARSTDIPS